MKDQYIGEEVDPYGIYITVKIRKGHRKTAEFACQRLLQYTNSTNGASRVYQNSRRTTCG